MKVLDRSGHTALPYDTEDRVSMEKVNEEFDRLVRSGAMVFDTSVTPPVQFTARDLMRVVESGDTESIITSTDDLYVVPAFQGG